MFKDENINKDLIKVINNHTEYIIKLEAELKTYKDFYTAISENNIIGDKFKHYEDTILELKYKIDQLKIYEQYYNTNNNN
tara:strand:- start:640 stop:879 length:240 start_codon:yes stop_codon:yes gene_type:complete